MRQCADVGERLVSLNIAPDVFGGIAPFVLVRIDLQERKQLIASGGGVEVQKLAAIEAGLEIGEILGFREKHHGEAQRDQQRATAEPPKLAAAFAGKGHGEGAQLRGLNLFPALCYRHFVSAIGGWSLRA